MKRAWLIGLSAAVGFALCGMNLGYAADKDSKSVTTTAKKPVAGSPTAEKAAAVKPGDKDDRKKAHRFGMRRLTPEKQKQVQDILAKYHQPVADLRQQIAKLQQELAKLESECAAETLAVFKEAQKTDVAESQKAVKEKADTGAAVKSSEKPVEKDSAPKKK